MEAGTVVLVGARRQEPGLAKHAKHAKHARHARHARHLTNTPNPPALLRASHARPATGICAGGCYRGMRRAGDRVRTKVPGALAKDAQSA
jgi:hypothetical protein